MTSFDRLERSLPAVLDELATPGTPDYFDDLLARTAATRQRPGWTFPERWFPMSAIAQRFAGAPRIPMRVALALALLLAAALIGALIAGGRGHVPAPFGPADNGLVVFTDDQGQVMIGNPLTSDIKIAPVGTGNERPQFSPDGTGLAFLRAVDGGHELVVARADGTGELVVSATPISTASFVSWSPDGRVLAVLLASGRLLSFDATRTGKPTDLSDALGGLVISVGGGNFNEATGALFRPPSGNQIVLVAGGEHPSIVVADRDGSDPHVVLEAGAAGLDLSAQGGQTRWSPDGTRISFAAAEVGSTASSTYVMNADGSGLHRAWTPPSGETFDEHNAQWSPDGTMLATQRWQLFGTTTDGESLLPVAIIDLATGTIRNVGPAIANGYSSFAWSPDGKSILEVPGDTLGEMLVVDVARGTWTTPHWTISTAANWQRVSTK